MCDEIQQTHLILVGYLDMVERCRHPMDVRFGRQRLGLLHVERRRAEQLRVGALLGDGRAIGRLERLAM